MVALPQEYARQAAPGQEKHDAFAQIERDQESGDKQENIRHGGTDRTYERSARTHTGYEEVRKVQPECAIAGTPGPDVQRTQHIGGSPYGNKRLPGESESQHGRRVNYRGDDAQTYSRTGKNGGTDAAETGEIGQKHDALSSNVAIHALSDAEFYSIEAMLDAAAQAFAKIASGQELDVKEASNLAHRAIKEKQTAQLARRWNTWNRKLSSNKSLSPTSKELVRTLVYRVERAQTSDEAGRFRVNISQFAEDTGTSVDTMARNLKNQAIPAGIIDSYDVKKEANKDGDIRPRWYVSLNQEVLAQPESIMLPTPNNHGGKPGRSFPCGKCGREDTKIKTVKRVAKFVVCPCGHKSRIEKPTVTITFEDAKTGEKSSSHEHEKHDAFGDVSGDLAQQSGQNASIITLPENSNMRDILKPITPPQVAPCVDPQIDDTPNCASTEKASAEDIMQAAAQLLVAIAGGEIPGVDSHHVEMMRKTEYRKNGKIIPLEKYMPALPHRMLTFEDALHHLQGIGGARGALCSYASGQARMLAFETDVQEEWPLLQAIASELAEGGYKPLLETSPAGRGGHLCIIYDELVNVAAARRSLYDASEALQELAQRPGAEYWPYGPVTLKRVRLPAGKYTRGVINEFCEVQAIASDLRASTDRQAVARILLENQTPAAIVSPLYIEEEIARQEEETIAPAVGVSRRQLRQSEESASERNGSECRPETVGGNAGQGVDARHAQKYQGAQLVKWGSPAYLIRRFNAQHTLEAIRPRERNGKALSPLRNERTASTSYYETPDGERWTDYGGGSRVSGDAFDLYCAPLVNDIDKKVMLRQLANELKEEARQAIETCAASGQALPAWIAEIITDAGQASYNQLRGDRPQEDGDGQITAPAARQVEEEHDNDGQAQHVAAIPATAQENGPGGVLGLKPSTMDLWGFATVLTVGDWVPMPDRPQAGPAQIVEIADNGDYTVLYFSNLRTYSHDGVLLGVMQK